MPYLYTRLSIYCCLSMCVTVASVSSHLVVRTQHFWKVKEKKIENKINIDLAIIASQSSKRQFMTPPPSQDSSSRRFYSSFEASPICPISSSSTHSLIFPPSSSTTSRTTVSLPFTSPASFTFFHRLQFLSSLCQY